MNNLQVLRYSEFYDYGELMNLATNLDNVRNTGFLAVKGGAAQTNVHGLTNSGSMTIGGLQNLDTDYSKVNPMFCMEDDRCRNRMYVVRPNNHANTYPRTITIGLQNLATDLWGVKNTGFLAVKGGAAQTNVHGLTNGGSMTIGGL